MKLVRRKYTSDCGALVITLEPDADGVEVVEATITNESAETTVEVKVESTLASEIEEYITYNA